MECPRCKGMMVQDFFEDPRANSSALSLLGWRCIMCGEILDPVIALNRQSRPAPFVSRTRRKFAAQLSWAAHVASTAWPGWEWLAIDLI